MSISFSGGETVAITAGEVRCGTSSNPSTTNASFTGANFVKDMGTAWTAGSLGGGLATGVSITGDDWYHIFALVGAGGHGIDFGADTNIAAANLLATANVQTAGLTRYRRIASVLENAGASAFVPCTQHGDVFIWDAPAGVDVNTTGQNWTGADNAFTIAHVPPDIRTEVMCRITMNSSVDIALIRSGGTTIGANPTLTDTPLGTHDGAINIATYHRLLTNTSQQLVRRVATDVTATMRLEVEGYVDARGRWD